MPTEQSTPDGEDDPATERRFSFTHDEPTVALASPGVRSEIILHLFGILIGVILLANGLVFVGGDILAALGYTEAATPVVFYSVIMSMNFLAMLGVGLAYLHWRDDSLLSGPRESLVGISLPTRWETVVIVAGFMLLVLVMMLAELLFAVFDVDTAENVAVERGMENPELFLVLLPIQFFLTAPGEELLFRGVVQGLVRSAYGIVPGVLLAAGIFALFHMPALLGGGGDIVPVLLVLFTSGVVLGFLYEFTGNLVVPVVVHALWNVLVFGTNYLEAVDALIVTL